MTIEAKIVADSISPEGKRLTTMQLRYPRFVHAEFMTHRVFSRNASSSRAIPVEKLIADLRRDPAMPVFWGSNKPGMQAGAELNEAEIAEAKEVWLEGMGYAIDTAQDLMKIGLHKQIANRVLEPWAHINVVVTATEWDNFYELRCHPDAQPEMRTLAEAMRDAQEASAPKELPPGEWHLPYVSENDKDRICFDMGKGPDKKQDFLDIAIPVSVARCARVSYLTHDGKEPDIEADLKLYERLVGGVPLHASPAEHQATPARHEMFDHSLRPVNIEPQLGGNLEGWVQYRKVLELQHL